jgi:hypothetical protein
MKLASNQTTSQLIAPAKGSQNGKKLVYEAHEKFGKTLNVAEMHKQRIIDAGFVDVRDDLYKVCAASIV